MMGAAIGEGPLKQTLLMDLSTIWGSAKSTTAALDGQRSQLRLDPSLLPEMALTEYEAMVTQYRHAHPGEVWDLASFPHKKLLERLRRDFAVHHVVP